MTQYLYIEILPDNNRYILKNYKICKRQILKAKKVPITTTDSLMPAYISNDYLFLKFNIQQKYHAVEQLRNIQQVSGSSRTFPKHTSHCHCHFVSFVYLRCCSHLVAAVVVIVASVLLLPLFFVLIDIPEIIHKSIEYIFKNLNTIVTSVKTEAS